ncbi:MAG: queuosine precursor transporter [Spirochaetes bacterium]|nr:queuosine precursor transporter [Spirochaetota bacterium]
MNLLLWLVLLLVNFAGILIAYKFFKKTGLYAWIAISIIIANIQVIKTVELMGIITTLGNIIYGTSFLATDILSEKYGKQAARKGVYIGIFSMVMTTIIIQVSLMFKPHPSDFSQGALETIFTILPRITIASITAYVLSQLHDVWAYNFWKNKNPHIWLRNNLSTMVSQLIDTLVFVFIAFWGIFELSVFVQIAITTYLLKWIVAALDTPFIYIAKKMNE